MFEAARSSGAPLDRVSFAGASAGARRTGELRQDMLIAFDVTAASWSVRKAELGRGALALPAKGGPVNHRLSVRVFTLSRALRHGAESTQEERAPD
jgi:hypothetical protein